MDYEKKIDIPFGANDSELKGWEYTIPEGMEAEIKDGKVVVRQKENEDERIRKQLINEVKEQIENIPAPDCCDSDDLQRLTILQSWLAYLEKQKEQKPAETSNVDLDTKVNDWIGYTLNNNAQSYSKKDVQIMLDNCARFFYDYAVMCLDKPAEWSEEDERMLSRCIKSIECSKRFSDSQTFIEAKDKEIDWLRSRVFTIKQEWSEEDKVILNNIIWGVHMKSIKPLDEMDDRSKYKKYEDFLKALPERFNLQPNWKPSEEQMDAFRCMLSNLKGSIGTASFPSLESLYDDLKKL